MYVSVLFHIRLLMESFPAVLARIRPCVGVNQKVGGERTRSLKAFAALLALLTKYKYM